MDYRDNDADFIAGAYNFLLRREPDSGGLAHYLGILRENSDRTVVLNELCSSDEFAAVTARAGYGWPLTPPPAYKGQLAFEVQAERSLDAQSLQLSDCEPYHTTEMPNGETIYGPWDLRRGEDSYLGGIDLNGRAILELGPATGHMTFWMESSGAAVTSLEVGYDRSVDVIPADPDDVASFRRSIMATVQRINNTWWFLHSAFEAKARMVYGDIYNLPSDIGNYDVGVFGAILLHLERPLRALAAAAEVCTEALVVCEPFGAFDVAESEARMRPLPAGTENLTGWWHMTPAAVAEMLTTVGFRSTEVTTHRQLYHPGHDMDQPPVEVDMFTVVGRR